MRPEIAGPRTDRDVWCRLDGETTRIRVEPRALIVDVEVIGVRLAGIEHRTLELGRMGVPARGDDAGTLVRRILPVMPDRRVWVGSGGWPLHVCHRSERRFADGRDIQRACDAMC